MYNLNKNINADRNPTAFLYFFTTALLDNYSLPFPLSSNFQEFLSCSFSADDLDSVLHCENTRIGGCLPHTHHLICQHPTSVPLYLPLFMIQEPFTHLFKTIPPPSVCTKIHSHIFFFLKHQSSNCFLILPSTIFLYEIAFISIQPFWNNYHLKNQHKTKHSLPVTAILLYYPFSLKLLKLSGCQRFDHRCLWYPRSFPFCLEPSPIRLLFPFQ